MIVGDTGRIFGLIFVEFAFRYAIFGGKDFSGKNALEMFCRGRQLT